MERVEANGYPVDLSGAEWYKSTRSGPNCDNCVQVAKVGGMAVRDSKDPAGPVLFFEGRPWGNFVEAAAGMRAVAAAVEVPA
jgi:hypothetical protein